MKLLCPFSESKLRNGNVVLIETREDCESFLQRMEELGIRWRSGKSPLEVDPFNDYGAETCICVTNSVLSYANYSWYRGMIETGSIICMEYKRAVIPPVPVEDLL